MTSAPRRIAKAAYQGAYVMIAKDCTITSTPQMYPTTRPKPPPEKIEKPARIASAAMRRSHTPQAHRWLLNSPFETSLIFELFAKYAIAEMIRKKPTESRTIPANWAQPERSVASYASVDMRYLTFFDLATIAASVTRRGRDVVVRNG